MAFMLSFLLALLASYMLDNGQRSVMHGVIQQGNDTNSIFRTFKKLSSFEYGNIFRSFYGGGGSGGDDDKGPTNFRPGGWNFFPFMESDSLLYYDLQWQPEENLMLFPKQWYEDEELVYAWNSIMVKENGFPTFEKVSASACRRIIYDFVLCYYVLYLRRFL